ncbi:MAG: UDP-N-acetylmuramoyl-L-alanyl-D-glutamate--2,6-diaminopimelate ligase [Pseudomonadota bacterium]|nr:UDP-N-acetylmuramoyl-L-alanyl-D-glutamate--2,6-diaminopimelate ligase [Pseudomonadota bacterium]
MKFSKLLGKDLDSDFEVQSVKEDSRQVMQGDVFVIDKRVHPEGCERFVRDALAKGARAVVTNLDLAEENVFYTENPFDISGKYAADKHKRTPKNIVAVTGTNGKTSVAWFYNAILNGAGFKAASIGTLGVYQGKELLRETGYTSPTPLVLHEILDGLADSGVDYCCMEVSSHALSLHRCEQVSFCAGAFTNITPDHRDFHGSMESYFMAKQRLFAECLPEGSAAVINVSQPQLWPVVSIAKQRGLDLLTVGPANAELVVKFLGATARGMDLEIKYDKHILQKSLPLVGTFQAENLATAIALCLKSGVAWQSVVKGLDAVQSVPGRMEVIAYENKPVVVVDYAHTPDALRTAIEALKPQVKGKLWTVFGCGGDRDKTKRPEMGLIAHQLSDFVVVTDDNPRTENAASIRKDILSACPNAIECGDRGEAIQLAVEKAGVDDVILLAGKGHESGQYIMGEVVPFNDCDYARKILKK